MSVEVRDISFSYGKTVVLREVSAYFAAGEFSVVLGPNGCGKTTLFNLICRICALQSGTVLLHGRAMSAYSRRQQAQTLSVLSQVGSVPEFMTVHDMVMQGRFCYQSFLSRYSDEDVAVVGEVMDTMAIASLAQKRVSELSGGQLQRTRMAMTLAQQTDIVLSDEPTTHLDLKHQYALLDINKALSRQGKTVVAILHDMTQAALYADKVIVLNEGRVYSAGTPQAVITDEMMQEVFGVDTCRIGNDKVGVHVPRHLV